MKLLLILLTVLSFSAEASDLCSKLNAKKPLHTSAVNVVAQRMDYTFEQLCTLPHLLDLYVVDTNLYNKDGEVEPHVWVTLHYNEYSCQYFVREVDMAVTKKNCYNTW